MRDPPVSGLDSVPAPSSAPEDIDFAALFTAQNNEKKARRMNHVFIFRHVCPDGGIENKLWAWSIGIKGKMEVRKKYDLGRKMHMLWREDYGLPRIINDDGIPEIKYPQLDPGWWSCRHVRWNPAVRHILK